MAKKTSLFYAKINTVQIDKKLQETEFFESEILFKIRLSETTL